MSSGEGPLELGSTVVSARIRACAASGPPAPTGPRPGATPCDRFAGSVVVVTPPGGSSDAAEGAAGPVGSRVARVRRPGRGRARRRKHLVGRLGRADQLVLLAGDPLDLVGVAQVLLLLRQRGVLGVQRGQLGLGRLQVGVRGEQRRRGKPGEEDHRRKEDRAGQQEAARAHPAGLLGRHARAARRRRLPFPLRPRQRGCPLLPRVRMRPGTRPTGRDPPRS